MGAGAALVLLVLSVPIITKADAAPGYQGVGVFEIPQMVSDEASILVQAQLGDVPGAKERLDQMLERYPQAGRIYAVRALLTAAQGNRESAIRDLLKADELGTGGLRDLMSQRVLAPLADDHRLDALSNRPNTSDPLKPALVRKGEAIVGRDNTTWDPSLARVVSHFKFPPILKTHSFKGNATGPLSELQRLVARGNAAGNVGDLYDNRDDGHSVLRMGERVQLTRTAYSAEARAAGFHYGLNTQVLFNAPTFGNSSTAITGPVWRSQPRLAMTTPTGAMRLWQLYSNNHLYVFPEHRDHDPTSKKGNGDLFPANTPYVLISQGSSGSDRPILQAVQSILAAFRPTVKKRLVKEKLIAPLVQQIFRRGLKRQENAGYLDGEAHPSVFRGEDIDLAEMIRLAQALRADQIPPVVNLEMRRETPPHPSTFADGLTEVLFDTPNAIGRIWRGAQHQRVYELEAQAKDPNDRSLRILWRVLRGDPERIKIEPLNEAGNHVRLTVPWHDPAAVPGRPDITSARVDIGVFADNGAQVSAPSFFSVLFPAHQRREYDAAGNPTSIGHLAVRKVYVDPLIWPSRNWQDNFDYDDSGEIAGWSRLVGEDPIRRFTSHGLEILETDDAGRASLAQQVTYPIVSSKNGLRQVVETKTDQRFRYRYQGPDDLKGVPVPVPDGD